MKKAILPLALAILVAASPALAQTEKDLLRFEWVAGLLLQGTMADVEFDFDTTPFGGILIQRDEGTLDVDPTAWYGIRTSYRLNRRWSVDLSWMRARSRYRVQFPAEARDEGNFDLEGLILGVFDSGVGQGRLESAATDARIDAYMATARWETPILRRWAYPYLTAGLGLYKQKSDGYVFQMEYESDPPSFFAPLFATGSDALEVIGISRFRIDSLDPVLAIGAGVRASLSQRWGADLEIEDVVQIGADYSHIDQSSTADTDGENFRLFSTRFQGRKGAIHNLAFRLSITYSFWPMDRPR